VLLVGDVQAEAEQSLLNHRAALRADLLIAPHHGSAEPTTPAFLRAVAPAAIVSSNDDTLTQKQRHFTREAAGIPLYRTNECGALMITIKNGHLHVEPFLN
jgi:competence protein ComEC